MSSVSILNIIPKVTDSKFTEGFKFEIIFEVLSELKKDLEWKMIYIGSASDPNKDQELENVGIGPLQLGTMKFEMEGDAPDYKKIPKEDLIGVTAIILSCSYDQREFFRCGYYINNYYDSEELIMNPPEEPDISHILRSVLVDKPRITVFTIKWDEVADPFINESDGCDNENNMENKDNNNQNFMFQGGKMDIEEVKKIEGGKFVGK